MQEATTAAQFSHLSFAPSFDSTNNMVPATKVSSHLFIPSFREGGGKMRFRGRVFEGKEGSRELESCAGREKVVVATSPSCSPFVKCRGGGEREGKALGQTNLDSSSDA
jgi:hypothetical protein